MLDWIDAINFSFSVSGIILTILGLIFVYKLRFIDELTRGFFNFFFLTVLCYVLSDLLSNISLTILDGRYVVLSRISLFLESFFSSLLLIFLCHYILYIEKLEWEKSPAIKIIYVSEFIYIFLLVITQYTTFIYYFDEYGTYHRGFLYPVLLVPPIVSMTSILIMSIRTRSHLSQRQFHAILSYILIPAAAMIIQMFLYGFLFIVIGTVIASIAFWAMIIDEQIREYLHQKEMNDIYQTDIMLLQMRPHFIYNTMSSIYYLCELDPKKAQTVVRDFSIYLKKNFSAMSKRELIPFEDELEHTRAYLAIEKARYEKLLFVEYDINYTSFQLPPLTLQPIVENAVKHGVDPDFPSLDIIIRTVEDDECSKIIVENSGPAFSTPPKNDKDVHVGLSNVRTRLEMMCNANIEITQRVEGGTIVTITIPKK